MAFHSIFSLRSVATLLVVTTVAWPGAASAMSIDEAYAAIPHRKTDFDPRSATMGAAERAYLEGFFELVNRAVVQRVDTWSQVGDKGKATAALADYRIAIEAVLRDLRTLNTPPNLWPVRSALEEAINAQSRYLERVAKQVGEGKRFVFDSSDSDIARSHLKLIEAYNILMRLYPNETAVNKNAFFDHLCALDFI